MRYRGGTGLPEWSLERSPEDQESCFKSFITHPTWTWSKWSKDRVKTQPNTTLWRRWYLILDFAWCLPLCAALILIYRHACTPFYPKNLKDDIFEGWEGSSSTSVINFSCSGTKNCFFKPDTKQNSAKKHELVLLCCGKASELHFLMAIKTTCSWNISQGKVHLWVYFGKEEHFWFVHLDEFSLISFFCCPWPWSYLKIN